MEEQTVINPVQQPNIPTPPEPKHHSFLTSKLFLITVVIVVLFTIIYAGIYLNLNSQLNQITKFHQAPMEMKPSVALCDLNEDMMCDKTDFDLFKKALGKKVGEIGYNPLADADADGVVTSRDAEMINFPFAITLPADTATPTPNSKQIVCTQDAKQCPDGSYVSRQPPTCEFAKCP